MVVLHENPQLWEFAYKAKIKIRGEFLLENLNFKKLHEYTKR